jgi:single-strand DNA-binding protein
MAKIAMTATGNIVNDPVYFEKEKDKPAMVSFRLASTPSRYKKKEKQWIDGVTSWFDVNAYGAIADHAIRSLKKGDPIVVTGDMHARKWQTSDGQDAQSSVIHATALGHNLMMGVTDFVRGNASDEALSESIEIIGDVKES